MAQISRKITLYIDGTQVDNTVKSIRAEIKKLENQQRRATIGSEEYITATKKIAELQGILDKQKEAVKDLSASWEKARTKAAETANIFMGGKAAIDMATGTYSRLKGAIEGYVEEAAKMDDAYALVMKTTGMTHDEVERLNEGLKKMETRTSREELNKLASEAGKLGISGVNDVESFVRAADQINVALGDDLGEGAMVTIGKMAQVYAASTKELQQGDLGQQMTLIGSALNELANSSTASAGNMQDFMARLGGS